MPCNAVGSEAGKKRLVGLAWIIVSAAGFGAMAIFAKIAYRDGVDLATLLFLRFALAGGFLFLWSQYRGEGWPRGDDFVWLVGMGAFGYVGQAYCFFAALQHASASVVALLLYLYPALVTLFSALGGKHTIDRGRWGAVGISLLGTVLVVGQEFSASFWGILYGLGAALIYALYILAGARVMPRVGALTASVVVIASAAIVYAGAMIWHGPSWPQSAIGWLATLGIAIFSTMFAILGFFKGLERLGATDAATLSTLEPVVTMVLAAAILGERLVIEQWLGAGLILGAVTYLARRR
ncbi:MAG: EamA family transporter [Rhodocyclaceae bacterium]|nr:EamA family transporter [Rhodocyclaceae bacterium]